eukprot:3311953-Pleurochrysis_carterae.AAC.2
MVVCLLGRRPKTWIAGRGPQVSTEVLPVESSRAGWDGLATRSEGERHGRVAERPRGVCAQRGRVCACPIGMNVKRYDTKATVAAKQCR